LALITGYLLASLPNALKVTREDDPEGRKPIQTVQASNHVEVLDEGELQVGQDPELGRVIVRERGHFPSRTPVTTDCQRTSV